MKSDRIVIAAGLALGLMLVLIPSGHADNQPQVKVEKKELLRDEHAKHDVAKPEEKPAEKKAEAKVSPDAKAELDKITAAYQKLTSLEVAGTVTGEFAASGEIRNEQSSFAGLFEAPNKFRHEMKGDIVVGSTGEKLFAYRPSRNDYKQVDAPMERVAASQFPNPMRGIVQAQNIGLMCALVDDAGKFLAGADGLKEISKALDVTLAGRTYTALDFKGDKLDYRLLIDPQSHLVRQMVMDVKRSIEASGRDDVEKAALTFDYSTLKPGAKVEDRQFAWSAPPGAKDIALADAEEGDAMALIGKDAPDFTLNGLDGKPVALKDQRGAVVVLDFWATWCGPCQESLPELNKLYKQLQGKGMKAFAVDLEEAKEIVQPVAAKLIPGLPVLLDENSDVAKLYGVGAIPQTVVVGKDGKVRKVFIGGGNESQIRSAVESALGD